MVGECVRSSFTICEELQTNERVQDMRPRFFLADTPQKVDNIHRAIYFAYSCFPFVQF